MVSIGSRVLSIVLRLVALLDLVYLIVPLLGLLSAERALQPCQHAGKLATALWLWKLSVCTFASVKVSIAAISLSTVVLNSRDRWEIVWLPENFAL